MGHSFSSSSKYSNSLLIEKIINENFWSSVILDYADVDKTKKIDFSENISSIIGKNKYVIKLDSEIPIDCNMTLFFPVHPDIDKRILWTKDYLGNINSMSKQINERIQQSNRTDPSKPLLSISCADHFYNFYNFKGNMYLFWAEILNITCVLNNDVKIITHIPFLLETNGFMNFSNCFIFPDDHIIPIVDIKQFLDKSSYDVFCCESDPRNNKIKTKVKTMTTSTAYEITNNLVHDDINDLNDDDLPFENQLLLSEKEKKIKKK